MDACGHLPRARDENGNRRQRSQRRGVGDPAGARAAHHSRGGLPRRDLQGRDAPGGACAVAQAGLQQGHATALPRHVQPRPAQQRARQVLDGVRHRAALRLRAREGVRLRDGPPLLRPAERQAVPCGHRRHALARKRRARHFVRHDGRRPLGRRHAHEGQLGRPQGPTRRQQPTRFPKSRATASRFRARILPRRRSRASSSNSRPRSTTPRTSSARPCKAANRSSRAPTTPPRSPPSA